MDRRGFLGLGALALVGMAAGDTVSAARRGLLAAAGGSGGFVLPTPYAVTTVTSAPEGGWVWFGSNRAIRSGDESIVGAVVDGDIKAYRIDNDDRSVLETTTLYDNFLDDDHEPPSFVVRGDGKIMAAFAYHVGPLYVGIGSSAGVLPAQAQVTNITSQVGTISEGVYGFTYASILYLSGEDRYYIFARYHDADVHPHVVFTYSDDDGATWAPLTVVADVTYHLLSTNGVDRIDLALSDHPLFGQDDDPDVNTSIYHLYYDGSWHQSDGTSASLPVANSGATLVYDGSTSRGWVWDCAMGADGKPRIVYVTYAEPFDTGAWTYRYARWTGSAWVSHDVADAGDGIAPSATPEHGHNYAGGIVLDHANPNVVWYSTNAGGSFQLYRAVTADNGATWTATALTADSDKNVRPVSVVGHDGRLPALFLYGTYTDYFDYSQGIKAVVAS